MTRWTESDEGLLVRYEDLITEPHGELMRCIGRFGIEVADGRVADFVSSINFESLSHGRQLGEVDTSSHYRKGQVGEWRSLFTDAEKALLQSRYGECIAPAGYSATD